jgi:3-phenylpropionate/cinnamic acid dioxygenase small subunit
MLGRMSQISLEAIADRMAIEDVLYRYSAAIDTKDFSLLADVFTEDGIGDYTASGGIRGGLPQIQQWLANALSIFSVVQHLVTNIRIELAGNEATSSCYLFNPLGYASEGGKTEMLYCGAVYRDRLVRTPQGWRIRERVIEPLYLDGKLPGM